MKTKLLLATLLLIAALALATRHFYRLADRLENDRHSFISRLEALTAQRDSLRNRCEVLRLDRAEFERLYQAEAEKLQAMKIKLRRVESVAQSVSSTTLTATAPLRDTIRILRSDSAPLLDTARLFRWSDPWNRIEATIRGDSMQCEIHSIDTLHQVVHRVPRRFLFFRWGTKALRQEIHSSNPSTRIIYTDYVIIAR